MTAEAAHVDYRRHLGRQIAALRKARGLRQEDLADMLDIERSYLSHLETGKASNPRLDLLVRMLHVLELRSMEQLFSGIPELGSEVLKRERPKPEASEEARA